MLRRLLTATRGVGGSDMLEDILPQPVDGVMRFDGLCEQLSDDDFRKKMVMDKYSDLIMPSL